ncbi:hypothetical protein MNB_SUP05-SYMBIONT-5-1244 [hydrothermal vent metagenome]|uniref:Uncharacterized protein n=1 Tax=hydrothermal vent metagenome TaxID=652676 RepID=A0A1W1E4F1_9ZZZZ
MNASIFFILHLIVLQQVISAGMLCVVIIVVAFTVIGAYYNTIYKN